MSGDRLQPGIEAADTDLTHLMPQIGHRRTSAWNARGFQDEAVAKMPQAHSA